MSLQFIFHNFVITFVHLFQADEYALRDIKKGEQIHCSYDGDSSSDGFLRLSGWKEFGL